MTNFYDLIKQLCRSQALRKEPPSSFSENNEENTRYKQLINEALSEIFSEVWNFRKDITTFQAIAGQSSYDRPNGTICDEGVVVNGDTYKYSLTNAYRSYKIVGSKIVLYPTPTDVQTAEITYLTRNSALAADGTPQIGLKLETDSPNIPEDFHDLIVKKAEMFYMRDKPNKNNAQAKADVQKRISQLIDLDRGTLEASPIITFG